MNKVEGVIVALYRKNAHYSYDFKIIGLDNQLLVGAHAIPPDLEKNIKSTRVWVHLNEDGTVMLDENGIASISRKTINIRELLLTMIPSKEIKQRLSNGQIKINNEVVKHFDVECDFDMSEYQELGCFLSRSNIDTQRISKLLSYTLNGERLFNLRDFFGSPQLLDGPTNVPCFKPLQNYVILSISKKEDFIFKNNEVGDYPFSITQ